MTGIFPVTEAVNVRLQMLHAHAERKRLLLHRQTVRRKIREQIPRTVSDCKNRMIGAQRIRRAVLCIFRGDKPPVFRGDAGAFRPEIHLAARRFNALSQRGNAHRKTVCSDMRLCLPENFLRRTAFIKRLQNLPDTRILCAGIELAV